MEGCYLGPSLEQYQCSNVYVPEMHVERIINTAELFPHDCPVPKLSFADAAHKSEENLTEALSNPAPKSLLSIGYEQFQATKTLQKIIEKYLTTIDPTTSPAPRVPLPSPITALSPRVPLTDPITAPSPRVPSIAPQQPTLVVPRQSQRLQQTSMS